VALYCAASSALAAEEVRLWHAMPGALGEHVESLAAQFNASQTQYRVVPQFKGSYDETLAAAVASRKSAAASPHIVQVHDAGTADIMARKDTVRPLWQVMSEAGQPLDEKYVPAVAGYFSDSSGKLLALPFSTSTPVLFFNRDAFKKANLDPGQPPKTWYDMPRVIGALLESGSACGLTTALPSWVLLENMSAWHNEQFATSQNGMTAGPVKLTFNTHVMMRWVSMLSSWQKSGYFTYAGRGHEAEEKFASGECALLTAPSASYNELRKNAKFDFGVAQLPYYDDVPRAPQNTLVGGAGLWVMGGKPKEQYRGAARFLAYLAKPEVQADWHQKTGFVPFTTSAYELARKQGFYSTHPGHEVAVRQLLHKAPTPGSRGIRLGNFREIRVVIEEELESVWGGKKTPFEALNTAVSRGNSLLDRFAKANRPG
jgi:sn-glycerol 3-phosphate transport system substrate-binding protein